MDQSAYEKARDANIRDNEAKLRSLGLGVLPPIKKEPEKRRKNVTFKTDGEIRQSSRLQNLPTQSFIELPDDWDDDGNPPKRQRMTRNNKGRSHPLNNAHRLTDQRQSERLKALLHLNYFESTDDMHDADYTRNLPNDIYESESQRSNDMSPHDMLSDAEESTVDLQHLYSPIFIVDDIFHDKSIHWICSETHT